MQDPAMTVLVSASGPIVLNVPRPERYALAKLLLYPVRLVGAQPEKANKDLLQAASLVDYLSKNGSDSLRDAWSDVLALQQRYPNINCAIEWPNNR